MYEDSVFQHSTHMSSRPESLLSCGTGNMSHNIGHNQRINQSHRKGRRSHCINSNLVTPLSSDRPSYSSSHGHADDENDTPLLYRSKEMVQKSFAAQNLKSLREGSFTDDSTTGHNVPLESMIVDDIAQDESIKFTTPDLHSSVKYPMLTPDTQYSLMDSIERSRQTSSAIGSPEYHVLSKPRFSIEPIDSDCNSDFTAPIGYNRKRPFRCVEKSPLPSRAHTGLTMEFCAVKIGDEDRLKRASLSQDESIQSPTQQQYGRNSSSSVFHTPENMVDLFPMKTTPMTPVSSNASSGSRIKKISCDAGLHINCSLEPPGGKVTNLGTTTPCGSVSPDQVMAPSSGTPYSADFKSLESSATSQSADEKMCCDSPMPGLRGSSCAHQSDFNNPVVLHEMPCVSKTSSLETPPTHAQQISPQWMDKLKTPQRCRISSLSDDGLGPENTSRPRPDPVAMKEAPLSSLGSTASTNSSLQCDALDTKNDVTGDQGNEDSQRTSSGSGSEARYVPAKGKRVSTTIRCYCSILLLVLALKLLLICRSQQISFYESYQ